MSRKNDSWGIEVGANAIKAVRLVRNGSEVVLADYDVLPFKQILTTPDLDAQEAIQVNLNNLISKHDMAKSNVVVSVPGHTAFARFAKLPPVEPKKIPDIVRFEAVQQIPFPIDQVEWDYQVFQQEDSPDVSVGIFAITKERVLNFLSNYRRIGLRVDALTLSPLAVYNAFSYETKGENPKGTIYLDIGTSSTDVIIVENEGIWLRTLPIGGNNFTEALVRAFKLSFPKAEKLKREASTSKYARQIFQAMRPVFADLVQELQRSLGYYQSLNRDANIERVVGVGSTFKLPGLQKFLKQQLQMEVTRPEGFKRITPDGKRDADFSNHALNMATAYGLALQGLGLESVSANIMPMQVLKQRMWRAKEPWVAAAAACVVLASGVAGGRYFMDRSSWTAAMQANQGRVQAVAAKAAGYESDWREISGDSDPRMQIENLRRVIDRRDYWPKLLEDISIAANTTNPQPELFSNDIEAIRKIPRRERRRLYIESIVPTYIVSTGQEGQQGQQQAGDDITAQYKVEDFFGEDKQPPSFEVTVTGTTPYGEGYSLLSYHFVRWLQDQAKNPTPNRPYRITVDEKEVLKISRVGGADALTGGSSNAAASSRTARTPDAARPGMRRPTSRFGRAGETPFEFGMDPSAFDPAGMMGGAQTRAVATEELYPSRPVTEEEQRESQLDWKFEVRFTVQLLPPIEARQAETMLASAGSEDAAEAPEDGASQQESQEPGQQENQQQSAQPQALRQPNGSDSLGEEATL